MATAFHRDETPPSSVHPIEFYSVADPSGTPSNNVAPGKQWLKTDSLTTPTWFELYRRNEDDDNWILMRAWTNDTLTEGDIQVADADGRLTPLAIGAIGEALVSDGSTLVYVPVLTQAAIHAQPWKDAVRVATTAPGTLATSFENGDTVDGVVLATNDRILIKDQASGSENGIYTVNASGAPTRATDADSADDILQAIVPVREGTANADTVWMLTTNTPITLGVTALSFTEFGGGAGGTVDIEDEGAAEGAADTIDFTGAGVSVSFAAGTATVNIPGGGSGVDLEDEGVAEGTFDTIDFVGSGVSVTDDGGGHATVNVTGAVPTWLSVHPDAPPGSPDADDDEFQDESGQSGPVNGLDAKWTQVNWGTTALSFDKGCAIFTPQDAGTTSMRILSQPVPGGNFRRRFKMSMTAFTDNFAAVGIVASQGTGATDNHTGLEWIRSTTDAIVHVRQWTDYNTISSSPVTLGVIHTNHWMWFDLEYDGTNIIFRISFDGVGFAQVHSEAVATHLGTLGNWGLMGWNNSVTIPGVCSCDWVRAI
jgi:hypothetical protein